MPLMDPSFAVWADVGVAIMPTTSIDAKNNDDFIAILPYTWFPQFLLTTTEIIAVRGCA
ncbi:MAG TPA: hypothetical protein VNZ53_15440 [Steroidobacteraceae bacterium]|nr:hypothetical protein [Steroidobacteraceae bacterium]